MYGGGAGYRFSRMDLATSVRSQRPMRRSYRGNSFGAGAHAGLFRAGVRSRHATGLRFVAYRKVICTTRESLASGAREGTEYLRNRGQQVAEQVSVLVDKGKEQVSEYVDRGHEVVDRGRAQWEEFVERGKNLVTDQTTRVSAAVDAGRQAYRANTDEPA